MTIYVLSKRGEYDLTWDAQNLTATVNGKIYSHLTGFRGDAITKNEEKIIRGHKPSSYIATDRTIPGLGTETYVYINFEIRDYTTYTTKGMGYELHEHAPENTRGMNGGR